MGRSQAGKRGREKNPLGPEVKGSGPKKLKSYIFENPSGGKKVKHSCHKEFDGKKRRLGRDNSFGQFLPVLGRQPDPKAYKTDGMSGGKKESGEEADTGNGAGKFLRRGERGEKKTFKGNGSGTKKGSKGEIY